MKKIAAALLLVVGLAYAANLFAADKPTTQPTTTSAPAKAPMHKA